MLGHTSWGLSPGSEPGPEARDQHEGPHPAQMEGPRSPAASQGTGGVGTSDQAPHPENGAVPPSPPCQAQWGGALGGAWISPRSLCPSSHPLSIRHLSTYHLSLPSCLTFSDRLRGEIYALTLNPGGGVEDGCESPHGFEARW